MMCVIPYVGSHLLQNDLGSPINQLPDLLDNALASVSKINCLWNSHDAVRCCFLSKTTTTEITSNLNEDKQMNVAIQYNHN